MPTTGSPPTNRTPGWPSKRSPARFVPKGEYLLDEVDGGTHLTFALHAELGGIKKLLMGGAVQKTMDSEVEATERLKSLLESMPVG